MTTQNYSESAIKILDGLDPIKLRPGQFTRTDSPLHIIQEVLDNAMDEALAGFATEVAVTLLPGGGVRISDNGRGIPVGLHPEKQIPVLQVIFTILYSGGKFDKAEGGAYSYAGGLHGVGVSVTNALSESLIAEVLRDGALWRIEFCNGDVMRPLERIRDSGGTGTSVTVFPNSKYFESPDIPVKPLREMLKSKAVLLPGLKVSLTDNSASSEGPREEFFYENGFPDYLAEIAGGEPVVPVQEQSVYAQEGDESFAAGEGAAWAFSWYEAGEGTGMSYVNLIPTPQHGTHVAGFRAALFNAIKRFAEFHTLVPKGLKISADDVFKGVRFVLSVRMLDPAFDNQTKDRLNSREGVRLVEKMVQPTVEAWLNHNPTQGKVVVERVIQSALSRQKNVSKVERKRSSSVVMLPGKLAACESKDNTITELFLVEGDSAGGSAKQARAKDYQAILPLRGKSLNVWEKTQEETMANEEIFDISTAIGITPHTLEDEVDFSKLRYGKVAILADADVDGAHIQVLLLTMFYRHFPQLIERGHIFVACPPLYSISAEPQGKRKAGKKLYAMDELERKTGIERLTAEGYKNLTIGRFKGLGEMNPPDLWETTLNPDTRRLLRVDLPDAARIQAHEDFENLMGKSKSGWRREWLERRGNEINAF